MMRVLLISHTSQSDTEGQPKSHCLAALPGIELCTLVPDRWKHYGHWRSPTVPQQLRFRFEVGKVALPWVGPAQNYFHWYPHLRQLLLDFKPDVIDLWEEPWGLVSAHACRLRNQLMPQVKIISETEQNINKKLPPPFEWLRKYTLRNADFAVARSGEAMNVLREKGYHGPARVVPNGVDADLFHTMDRAQCRAALQLGTGFVVAYLGRLVEEKGLLDLVDAVAKCPADVTLLLVGSGPLESAIRSRAAEKNMSDRLRILPAKPLAELPQVMNAIDAMVLPSRTTARWKEQFGRVLIEAGVCGTAVIGSDSGAIPDVVGDGGLVFPEGNIDSLVGAIMQLRQNPDLKNRLGQNGRQNALGKCTWQQVAKQMFEIYAEVVAK